VFEPTRSTYVHFLVFLKKVPNSSEQEQNTAKKTQTFEATDMPKHYDTLLTNVYTAKLLMESDQQMRALISSCTWNIT